MKRFNLTTTKMSLSFYWVSVYAQKEFEKESIMYDECHPYYFLNNRNLYYMFPE